MHHSQRLFSPYDPHALRTWNFLNKAFASISLWKLSLAAGAGFLFNGVPPGDLPVHPPRQRTGTLVARGRPAYRLISVFLNPVLFACWICAANPRVGAAGGTGLSCRSRYDGSGDSSGSSSETSAQPRGSIRPLSETSRSRGRTRTEQIVGYWYRMRSKFHGRGRADRRSRRGSGRRRRRAGHDAALDEHGHLRLEHIELGLELGEFRLRDAVAARAKERQQARRSGRGIGDLGGGIDQPPEMVQNLPDRLPDASTHVNASA